MWPPKTLGHGTPLQEGQSIEYASRALTSTEIQYAQIEKELLTIVFAFERFLHYTYGRSVQVESDHKPLETISRKPLHAAPKRLLLRLQRYNMDFVHKSGKQMHIADTLSRAYLPSREETRENKVLQFYQELESVDMLYALPISPVRCKNSTTTLQGTPQCDT